MGKQRSKKEQAAELARRERWQKKVTSYWAKCAAILFFLILWFWFVGAQTDWWLFSNTSRSRDTLTGTPLDTLGNPQDAASTAPANGGGGGTGGNGGGSGGGTGGGGSTSTTTNTSTTNNNSTTTNNGGGGSGGADDTNIADTLNSIVNGLTRQQLLDATVGLTPDCIQLTVLGLGIQETCRFVTGEGTFEVTLLNGVVVGKTQL